MSYGFRYGHGIQTNGMPGYGYSWGPINRPPLPLLPTSQPFPNRPVAYPTHVEPASGKEILVSLVLFIAALAVIAGVIYLVAK